MLAARNAYLGQLSQIEDFIDLLIRKHLLPLHEVAD
jgi:hypothetical protein